MVSKAITKQIRQHNKACKLRVVFLMRGRRSLVLFPDRFSSSFQQAVLALATVLLPNELLDLSVVVWPFRRPWDPRSRNSLFLLFLRIAKDFRRGWNVLCHLFWNVLMSYTYSDTQRETGEVGLFCSAVRGLMA